MVMLVIIGGVALIAFTGAQPTAQTDSPRTSALQSEKALYTDLSGNPFSFDQFSGQVLVVNSWATWCPFCVNELPDFAELATLYKDQGVTVVAINRSEDQVKAKAFVRSLRAVDGIEFVLDPTDFFYRSIGGFTMPETVFYDRAGNVVVHKQGFMTLAEMQQHLEAALTSGIDN